MLKNVHRCGLYWKATREDVLVSWRVVTNYHKLSGLKQHKFVILQVWTSEDQNQSQWAKIKVLQDLF